LRGGKRAVTVFAVALFAGSRHAFRLVSDFIAAGLPVVTGLRLSDFTAGTVYTVSVGDQTCPLALDKVQPLSDSGREGGSFRLEFLGPADPVLPQATYGFGNGEATHDIFIVPVGREAGGIRYEAVFY
jgi:uncharacterized protein DUF6916